MCSFDRGFLVNYCLTHIMYHQVLSFTLMCLVFYRQSTPDRRTGIMGSGKFIDTIITPNVAHINVKLQKCSAKFFFFFFLFYCVDLSTLFVKHMLECGSSGFLCCLKFPCFSRTNSCFPAFCPLLSFPFCKSCAHHIPELMTHTDGITC